MTQRDVLEGRRVVVLGAGRQGRALARWLPQVGASVVLNDSRTAGELGLNPQELNGVELVLGSHPISVLDGAELLCISGGVPLNLPIVRKARQLEIPLSNDAQLFIERCRAPVIGITGSAGKTTTTTLTGQIITQAGYRVHVGGNIGHVLLDDLAGISSQDIVVMELSSFQLEIMTVSPAVAVVLNVTPNHLDRHGNMESYLNAKANILRYQRPDDVAVLGYDDPGSRSMEVLAAGELVWFSAQQIVADGAFMMGQRLMVAGAASYDYVPHVVCERNELPLRGEHNVLNVLAAAAAAGSLGLAARLPGIAPDMIGSAIRAFKPVPHRLELVREVNGVAYVNDSIATAPERVVAALRSYSEPLILLLGGRDKDLPWEEVLLLALKKSRCIIAFGEPGEKQVGDKVQHLLSRMGAAPDVLIRVPTLEEAVRRTHEIAQPGEVVLLSPGGTSYDAYQDFAERGEHFRRLVSEL